MRTGGTVHGSRGAHPGIQILLEGKGGGLCGPEDGVATVSPGLQPRPLGRSIVFCSSGSLPLAILRASMPFDHLGLCDLRYCCPNDTGISSLPSRLPTPTFNLDMVSTLASTESDFLGLTTSPNPPRHPDASAHGYSLGHSRVSQSSACCDLLLPQTSETGGSTLSSYQKPLRPTSATRFRALKAAGWSRKSPQSAAKGGNARLRDEYMHEISCMRSDQIPTSLLVCHSCPASMGGSTKKAAIEAIGRSTFVAAKPSSSVRSGLPTTTQRAIEVKRFAHRKRCKAVTATSAARYTVLKIRRAVPRIIFRAPPHRWHNVATACNIFHRTRSHSTPSKPEDYLAHRGTGKVTRLRAPHGDLLVQIWISMVQADNPTLLLRNELHSRNWSSACTDARKRTCAVAANTRKRIGWPLTTSEEERKEIDLKAASPTAEDTDTSSMPLDESPLIFDPSRYVTQLQEHWAADGGNASYGLLTRCFVLVNATTSRIKIVDTLDNFLRVLIEADPSSLLPAVPQGPCLTTAKAG
ncbi:hypothetical protein Purlil1_12396 [Purpureocillium lilacinum]|uniref:Uncharacterized protein n=1 Tax=Purpureocillium lilacinum TaxID=33203 RepID=A0ABR0BH09_PURLI|nr:hypothetical protein Purlil1_12396 [Purpureocillium lilacinum]